MELYLSSELGENLLARSATGHSATGTGEESLVEYSEWPQVCAVREKSRKSH
jgi:hypothetical protein